MLSAFPERKRRYAIAWVRSSKRRQRANNVSTFVKSSFRTSFSNHPVRLVAFLPWCRRDGGIESLDCTARRMGLLTNGDREIRGSRMKILVGYELIYDLPQSTPMIMVLGT